MIVGSVIRASSARGEPGISKHKPGVLSVLERVQEPLAWRRRPTVSCGPRPVVMEPGIGTPRKRHVLIVDDDIALAWPFKESLESRGYEATIVPDGALALKFALEH